MHFIYYINRLTATKVDSIIYSKSSQNSCLVFEDSMLEANALKSYKMTSINLHVTELVLNTELNLYIGTQ